MKRLLLLTSVVLTIAVFPATSVAAPARGSRAIYTDPIQIRAYEMSFLAVSAGDGHGALLDVTFVRRTTKGTYRSTENHIWQFTKGVKVLLAPHGGSGRIKADLGRFGQIDMSFSAGGGARTVPGCPGAFLFEHQGLLSGKFHFMSESSYFKTIDKHTFGANTATTKPGLRCIPSTSERVHGTMLSVVFAPIPGLSSAGSQPLGNYEGFDIERGVTGFIQEQFLVLDASLVRKGVVISHALDASGLPSSAFTNAADLSSATAQAQGPWMRGTVDYTASSSGGTTTEGTIGGSITADFDGLAPITLTQTPATFSALTSR